MIRKLSESDLTTLEKLFVEAKGRGFEPSNRRGAVLMRALKAGWVQRADADFFSDRARGSHILFTEAGKNALIRRLATRHRLDADDCHHLVRVGNYPFPNTGMRERPAQEEEDDGYSADLLPLLYEPRSAPGF